MRNFFERIYIHLKSIKILFFVPLVAVHIFLPIISIISYHNKNLDFYMTVMEYSLIIMPISSVLWSLFILREYVEGKGNELLYVVKNKNIFLDCFVVFLLFYFTIVIHFLIYSLINKMFICEIIRLFAICLFFFELSILFVFLTHSVSLGLMALTGYSLLNILLDFQKFSNKFIFYYDLEPYSKDLFFEQSVPMFITAIVISFFNAILYKFNKKYN